MVVVFLLPLVCALQELLPTEVVPCLLLAPPEHLLNNALCSNTCMIASRQVECGEAAHTVPSDQNVLERCGEGVSAVELAGDVGRRNGDDEVAGALDGAVGLKLRLEEALLLPPVIWPKLAYNVANTTEDTYTMLTQRPWECRPLCKDRRVP